MAMGQASPKAQISMIFERTWNSLQIRAVLTHPKIYPYVTDDFAPPREQFQVNEHPAIWYVRVRDEDGELLGLFTLLPENEICWQAHVAMIRGTHPVLVHQAGKGLLPWIWENTPCERIEAAVPACNRAAIWFGIRSMGLIQYAIKPLSFRKKGRLWDQVLMGRSKPDAGSHQR
jgi:hypothetical protein